MPGFAPAPGQELTREHSVCGHGPRGVSRTAFSQSVAWSSVNSWLLLVRSSCVSALVLLPAPAPLLHMPAPLRRGAVADARPGLA